MGKARKPPAAKRAAESSKTGSSYVYLAAGAAVFAVAIPLVMSLMPPKTQHDSAVSDGIGGATEEPQAASRSLESNCAEGADDFMCAAWHKAGLCRSAPTRRRCQRTCGLCPGVPPRNPVISREDRCRRDNLTAAVGAGQLKPLFERILRDFPQFEPEALSTSPYVLLLKNFLSEKEAAAFLKVCQKSFERSLAGDQLNPVRTSFQCWCNFPPCFTDPDVHAVTSRINDLLGIPYDNGEDLQVVRYEPGQFYRRHHDQNTALWTPQGPRVLTFFMYLNQPAAGGETAFPEIGPPRGLRVSPQLGHAILWPSTLDERPMDSDMRTDHEAMPVHEGIKYGANMWVHQFSFKTPSERGCELTYVNTVGRHPSNPEHQALVSNGRVPSAEDTIKMAMSSPAPSGTH